MLSSVVCDRKEVKLVKGQQRRRAKRLANTGDASVSSSQPKLQPARVLLRHLYLLNPEHTKYVSVGLYPDRDYQACVEFGSARQAPVVLTLSSLATLSVQLAKLCEHLCKQQPYRFNDLFFRLQTVTGDEPAARMPMDRRSITLKAGELNYLLLNLPTFVNQLAQYRITERDVGEFVQSATGSTAFVAPNETASLFVQYDVLFEESTG